MDRNAADFPTSRTGYAVPQRGAERAHTYPEMISDLADVDQPRQLSVAGGSPCSLRLSVGSVDAGAEEAVSASGASIGARCADLADFPSMPG